jgi:hypothetical protein
MGVVDFGVGHGTWSRISVLELGGWLVILVTFD